MGKKEPFEDERMRIRAAHFFSLFVFSQGSLCSLQELLNQGMFKCLPYITVRNINIYKFDIITVH